MFDNIGSKIKKLAELLCWIGMLLSIIGGVILMYAVDSLVPVGTAIVFIGPLLSWISSFVLYGFGELVENSAVAAGKNETNTKV